MASPAILNAKSQPLFVGGGLCLTMHANIMQLDFFLILYIEGFVMTAQINFLKVEWKLSSANSCMSVF